MDTETSQNRKKKKKNPLNPTKTFIRLELDILNPKYNKEVKEFGFGHGSSRLTPKEPGFGLLPWARASTLKPNMFGIENAARAQHARDREYTPSLKCLSLGSVLRPIFHL